MTFVAPFRTRIAGVAGSAAAGNGLLNSLIAYWPGNEASGNLIDAHSNGLDLTDNNTVTNNTGLVYATARQYTSATSEYHERADEALLSTGDVDFTVAQWLYTDTIITSSRHSISKAVAGTTEYHLQFNLTATRFRWNVNAQTVDADNLGAPSASTWYLVVAWHDSVANSISVQVNNGGVDSQGTITPPSDTATSLKIGCVWPGVNHWTGRIGPTMFWKSAAGAGGVLTADQRTALYNAGAGLTYAEFTV